jgi:hypothetical protein
MCTVAAGVIRSAALPATLYDGGGTAAVPVAACPALVITQHPEARRALPVLSSGGDAPLNSTGLPSRLNPPRSESQGSVLTRGLDAAALRAATYGSQGPQRRGGRTYVGHGVLVWNFTGCGLRRRAMPRASHARLTASSSARVRSPASRHAARVLAPPRIKPMARSISARRLCRACRPPRAGVCGEGTVVLLRPRWR